VFRTSSLRLYLYLLGLTVVAFSIYFSIWLTRNYREEEEQKMNMWAIATENMVDVMGPEFQDQDSERFIDFLLMIQQSNTSIPVILVDERDSIYDVMNFDRPLEGNKTYFRNELSRLRKEGVKPIQGHGYASLIYYKSSRHLDYLKWFPVIQFGLISLFIFIGYRFLRSARQAEQNRLWVGMAKETAHQLGTPVSAIMAWIEHLRQWSDSEEKEEVVTELTKDVQRLQLVAERFSKIGSKPELVTGDLRVHVLNSKDYMSKRAPRKVLFDFTEAEGGPLSVYINAALFDWVLENLIRNALDALEGKGTITACIYEDDKHAFIDITDSGKGIAPKNISKVFQPGFSTKKRGWGLGLSLSRRIIKDYHKGEIFVKKSEVNKGTTFTIMLHKAEIKKNEISSQDPLTYQNNIL